MLPRISITGKPREVMEARRMKEAYLRGPGEYDVTRCIAVEKTKFNNTLVVAMLRIAIYICAFVTTRSLLLIQ